MKNKFKLSVKNCYTLLMLLIYSVLSQVAFAANNTCGVDCSAEDGFCMHLLVKNDDYAAGDDGELFIKLTTEWNGVFTPQWKQLDLASTNCTKVLDIGNSVWFHFNEDDYHSGTGAAMGAELAYKSNNGLEVTSLEIYENGIKELSCANFSAHLGTNPFDPDEHGCPGGLLANKSWFALDGNNNNNCTEVELNQDLLDENLCTTAKRTNLDVPLLDTWEVYAECDGGPQSHSGTNNTVSVRLRDENSNHVYSSGDTILKDTQTSYCDFMSAAISVPAGTNVKTVSLETNGGDALWIDRIRLVKITPCRSGDDCVKEWGVDNNQGWVLSEQAEDGSGSWSNYVPENRAFRAINFHRFGTYSVTYDYN